ncbi:ciliary neurotrophic factor [Aplochiton taeniatus]
MAEQQEITVDGLDMPAAGRSKTWRAAELARLLHHECTRLLALFREKESFITKHIPAGGRIVPLSLPEEDSSSEEQVQLLHSALRQCLGLLHCLILKEEEEEMGASEGEYEAKRKVVRASLERLLHSTRVLLECEGAMVEITPDHQCNEEVDGGIGAFGGKMWTYRVLLELTHWADSALQTLNLIHTESEGAQED